MIDTTKVKRDIFDVQQLWRGGYIEHYSKERPAEYLIHGVVHGDGLSCVRLEALGWNELHELTFMRRPHWTLPAPDTTHDTGRPVQCPMQEVRQIAFLAMDMARRIVLGGATANLYHRCDPELLCVASAFVGFRFARYAVWTDAHLRAINKVFLGLLGRPWSFSKQFLKERWLEEGIVYTRDFPDVERSLQLIRYVRSTTMGAPWTLSAIETGHSTR